MKSNQRRSDLGDRFCAAEADERISLGGIGVEAGRRSCQKTDRLRLTIFDAASNGAKVFQESIGAIGIIRVGTIAIRRPFPSMPDHLIRAVGGEDRFGGERCLNRFFDLRIKLISPGVDPSVGAAGRFLPLLFGRKPLAERGAIIARLLPSQAGDRLIRIGFL